MSSPLLTPPPQQPAQPQPEAPNRESSSVAGRAFWAMMRRIVLLAALIDGARIAVFASLASYGLAALNVASVVVYIVAYVLIGRRRNVLALSLIWGEVLVQASVGSLLIGWDSGYFYFLLLFIPAIVVGSSRRNATPLVLLLLAFYLALNWACRSVGALSPLQGSGQTIVEWINIGLIFAMFFSMAGYYRVTVIRAEKKLREQATTDGLTGLANRTHFIARASADMARVRRNGAPLSLVLADLDWFKRVNDELGHEAGDRVLVEVANRLKLGLRDVDTVARWGGEEFIMVLHDTPAAGASGVAERLRQAVAAEPVRHAGIAVEVSMSFGVVEMAANETLQAATRRADTALYASKKAGRNRVTLG